MATGYQHHPDAVRGESSFTGSDIFAQLLVGEGCLLEYRCGLHGRLTTGRTLLVGGNHLTHVIDGIEVQIGNLGEQSLLLVASQAIDSVKNVVLLPGGEEELGFSNGPLSSFTMSFRANG